MKIVYYLAKLYCIGLAGLIGTYFSDMKIFKYMCVFGLFVFLELFLNATILKDSVLQIIGILKLQKNNQNNVDYETYQNELIYSLPFKGEWVCVNGCVTKEYSHSWDIPTQRYAYDFLILDENKKSYEKESKVVSDYYCYGKEILAPADGVVVEVNNKSNDSIIINSSKYIVRAKQIAGNYIIIRHAENEYSVLAHLKKDSFLVQEGDKVVRGQVLALCGNTGNSSEPHLHFHIQKGQSIYNSMGLPIKFENISKHVIDGYEQYDGRKHMEYHSIPDNTVTRGFNYSNSAL